MNKTGLVLVLGVSVMLLTGCAQNKTRVAEGTGIGAVLGAGLGAIIGHQSGHGMEGALIGGAVGAAGGAGVGSQMEKPQEATAPVSQ